MKKIRWSAFITMIVSLMISVVSGYCTVVGMGKVFASAALVTMFISSVIEVGRVVLLYDLHHYWEVMKFKQKLPGVLMLLIAMTLSAMGVYGFFANAHSQRTQDIIPIEMTIKNKESQIESILESIEINNKQLEQFNSKATDKLTEMGYVTKALNAQKDQMKVTQELYDSNRQKQEEIANIKKEILQLKLEAEQKAPTLAHIKYYAKLLHVDDEMAIIIFIVMIMLVFDTLAMYLMITADWITKLDENEFHIFESKKVSHIDVSNIEHHLQTLNERIEPTNYDKIEDIVKKYDSNNDTKLDQIIEKFNDVKQSESNNTKYIADNILSLKQGIEGLKDNMLSITDMETLKNDFISANNSTQNNMETYYNNYIGNLNDIVTHIDSLKDNNLFDKLSEIEDRVRKITDDNDTKRVIVKKRENNIDNQVENLVELIDNNIEIIDSIKFKNYIYDNYKVINKLKDYYKDNEEVMSKLNKL